MKEFVPHPRWTGGHWMTLYTWGRRRRFNRLPAPQARYFDVATDARVLADCYWQPQPSRHPTLLALHGLEGSSAAHYMRGLADKAFARGFNAVLLNQRNCGGTEHLSAGLYHSGLTEDPIRVMRELVDRDGLGTIAVVGYSLGGNLALKLAGDYGAGAPPELRCVCAVSPIIEIGLCVAALEQRRNFIYQWNFVKDLKRRMRRKAGHHPGRFAMERLGSIRTVRQFDEAFTAPYFGFRNADDYYHRASAMRVVDRIAIPALIVAAEDDPFVPSAPFRDPLVAGNPHITLLLTPHGGHCGFVSQPVNGRDGYWAEERIIEFVAYHVAAAARPSDDSLARDAPAMSRSNTLRF